MSCFVCSIKHISVLAAYAVAHNLAADCVTRYTKAEWVACDDELLFSRLYAANVQAWNTRYPRNLIIVSDVVRYDKAAGREYKNLSWVEIYKLAYCFDYQADESCEWTNSVVAKIVKSIMQHAVCGLPEYVNARWEI